LKHYYSEEFESVVLSKLLPPLNRSVRQISQEAGIALRAFYHWRDEARTKGKVVLGIKKTTEA
jgi:hypothetical protein